MTSTPSPTPGPPQRPALVRGLSAVAGVAISAIALVAVALAVTVATGHKLAVERSDSMAPALHAGDLLISKPMAARDAKVGQTITFADPDRPGQTLTHRVRSIRPARGGQLRFVTRGDANLGKNAVERWQIKPEGAVSRVTYSLPAVGGLWEDLRRSPLIIALIAAAALAVLISMLRWIWRDDPDEPAEIPRAEFEIPKAVKPTRA